MDFKPEVFTEMAELLKALAHPIRLCIVKGLLEQESCNVSHMTQCLDFSQSGISQHLSKLKSAGIVKSERSGNEIYYSITDGGIRKKLKTLLSVL